MNKLLNLKSEVINLRSLLFNYKKIIPYKQLPRFEKDLNLLFENYQYLSEEKDLEKMKKLAKTKLNSMKRVYGELTENETTIDKEFLNEEQIKFNEKILEEEKKLKEQNNKNPFNNSNDNEDSNDYNFVDYNKRLEKLKNSDFFNKEKIQNAQKEKEEYDEMVLKAYKEFEQENNKKKMKEFKENKGEFIKNYKTKLENYVKDIAKQKNVGNLDQLIQGFDFEKLAEEIINAEMKDAGNNLNNGNDNVNDKGNFENERSKENMDDILSSFENILSGSKIFF